MHVFIFGNCPRYFNLGKFISYLYGCGVVKCYNAYDESYKLRGNLWTRVFLIIKRRSYIL